MALAAATRYYPGLEFLLMQFVPTSIRKMQEDHYATALEKIHRRMRLETQRDDFMTPILEYNLDYEKMSLSEIESTMALLLIAGSETTGTTLCGITNYLVQNPLELRKLEKEIRSNFEKQSDITFRAIQDLPFLNAVIHEGLRLCNPVAGGMPRIVPKGGDTVSGYFLPGGVSKHWPAISGNADFFFDVRPMLRSIRRLCPAQKSTSTGRRSFYPVVSYLTLFDLQSSRMINGVIRSHLD